MGAIVPPPRPRPSLRWGPLLLIALLALHGALQVSDSGTPPHSLPLIEDDDASASAAARTRSARAASIAHSRKLYRAARGHSNVTLEGQYLWCPLEGVLDSWFLFPLLIRVALGVGFVPREPGARRPDVLLMSMYKSNDPAARSEGVEMNVITANHARDDSLVIFVAGEVKRASGFTAHGLTADADLSFSGARTLSHLWRYVSWPVFMHAIIDRARATAAASAISGWWDAAEARGGGGEEGEVLIQPPLSLPLLCPIHASLFTPPNAVDGDAWRMRPHFALFLSYHDWYPRHILYAVLNRTLHPPDEHIVHHPGPMATYRNTMWPDDIPNTAAGKILLLKRYRFSFTPENNLDMGYVTEKLIDAHRSGAVPIYWGDIASFPEVLNPARVLVWDEVNDKDGATLLARVAALETDPLVRAAFFSQPVLASRAQSWVTGQCELAAARLGASISHLVRRNKTDIFASAGGGDVGDEEGVILDWGDCEARERDGWPILGDGA